VRAAVWAAGSPRPSPRPAPRWSPCAHAIDVLTLDGDRIAEVNVFMDPEAFTRFGLPDELAEEGQAGS
jgi:hypothetical protein